MPKLSPAIAASALLIALSAPSFAADLDTSTSQHNSATIQKRENLNADTSTRSSTNKPLNDKDKLSGSASLNNKSTLDRDRDIDRPQSAQMPKEHQDTNGPGRSSMSPGHEMEENGSVPGSPGASATHPVT